MNRRRFLAVVGLAMGTALFAAACGGGEEVTPAPRPTTAPQPTATTAPRPTATPAAQPTAAPRPTPTTAPQPTATRVPATAAPTGPSGTLRVAVSSFGFENMDPSAERISNFGIHGAPIYDWLVWQGANGDLVPGVAEKWEMSTDGKTWTFTLRSGMRFHDGTAVTAEDVKFSLERLPRPGANSTNVGLWRGVDPKVDVVSPTTARVNLKTPLPLANYFVAPIEGPEGAVLPKTYFERVGADGFQRAAMGTGPWQFVRWEPGIRFVYKAAEAKHPYRATPAYKDLEILQVPEESTRVAMIRTNQAQIVAIAQASLPGVRAAGLGVLTIAGASPGGINFFGVDEPGFDRFPTFKKEVRQAMQLAINKKEFVDTVLEGVAEVQTRWVVTPGSLGYDPSWQPTPFDPNRAKELLAQAGYPRGFDFSIYSTDHPAAPWVPKLIEAASGYWSAIGINTQIIPVDTGTMATLFRRWPHQEMIGRAFGFFGAVSPTNLNILRAWYYSKGVIRLMQNAEWDGWFERATATLDPNERVQLIRQMVDYVHNQWISIPSAIAPALFAAVKEIDNWQPIRAGYAGMALETVKKK